MNTLPDTTFEQRSPLYEDVRSLISPGFIAHPVDVNGVPMSIRSLGVGDFFLLKHRVGHKFDERRWQSWMVAMSIWMIDGQVVMGDEKALYRLYKMISSLPNSLRISLFSLAMSLIQRMDKAVSRTEAFLYETESRYLWKSEGRDAVYRSTLSDHSKSSFNPVQKLWLYFNTVEDERDQYNQTWTMAKFQIGPHAPKSIQKLNQKDKQQEESLEKRRESVRALMYYTALGVLGPDGEEKKDQGPYQEFHVAYTVEELQEQMRQWVAGEKDNHDRTVDAIKAKIRYERESEKAEQAKRQAELARIMEEEGITGSTLRPMSQEDAEGILSRLRDRSSTPGAKKIFQDDGHNSAYEKYIKNNPDVGVLRADENGNLIDEGMDDETREKLMEMLSGKPEKRDFTSEIRSRRPEIKYDR